MRYSLAIIIRMDRWAMNLENIAGSKLTSVQAYFDVLPPRARQPWGSISTGTELSQEGPMYHEAIPGGFVSRWKVSRNGDPEVSVLLARLRFKTDASAPTSL